MPIRINFTRGNRGQRGVDRFGVELSTGECQLRIVEEPLGRSSSQLFHVSKPRSLKPVRKGPGLTVATSIPSRLNER
jgi:hypothetical protein